MLGTRLRRARKKMNILNTKFLKGHKKNDLIYHYTSIENAIEILGTKKLVFSKLANTNDPFEFANIEVSIETDILVDIKKMSIQEMGMSKTKYIENQLAKLPSMVNKSNTKVICFSNEKRINSSAINPRMWAQYARNNSGCCLVFSKKKIEDIAIKHAYTFRSIEYVNNINEIIYKLSNSEIDEYLKIDTSKANEKLSNIIFELLFTKRKEWIGENEIRLVNNVGDDFINISDALLGVISGCKTTITNQKMLLTLVKDFYNVQLGITEWKNGNGKISRIDNVFYLRLSIHTAEMILNYFCEKYNKINRYIIVDIEIFTNDFGDILDKNLQEEIKELFFGLEEKLFGKSKDNDFKYIYNELYIFLLNQKIA